MSQLSLFPVELVNEEPPEPGISKDLLWIGWDEQGHRYALKTVEPAHPTLPLTEWLCYHLCALAGIPAPDFAIVQRLDGSLAFGSRWQEDAQQFSPAKVSQAQLFSWLQRASEDLGRMFALDAFMPNEDRHLGNILFTPAGQRLRALAFDWSRTHFFAPWPWAANSNSAQVWHWLQHNRLTHAEATRVSMQRISAITQDKVLHILLAAPEAWRDNLDCDAAAHWWGTQSQSRANDALALLLP